jgi:Transcriptional regulator C-terminal region
MREQLADLVAPVQTLLREPGDQVVYNAIVRWLEQVAQHASFFRIMLGKSGNAAFATQLLVYLETIVRMEARRQRSFQMPSPPQDKVRLRFIAAGFLGVTGWWLEQKQALSVHEVAMQLHTLLNTVMHAPTTSPSES